MENAAVIARAVMAATSTMGVGEFELLSKCLHDNLSVFDVEEARGMLGFDYFLTPDDVPDHVRIIAGAMPGADLGEVAEEAVIDFFASLEI